VLSPQPAPPCPLRLLLVDAHASVREGLRILLAETPDLLLVGEAADGRAAVALARALRPDVVLLDLALPGADGVATIRRLRAASPAARVLVLTGLAGRSQVRGALAAGATGYLLKDVLWDDLRRAIHRAARGLPVLHPAARCYLRQEAPPGDETARVQRLTGRERRLLGLLAGSPGGDGDLAAALGVSPDAARRDVDRLLGKLGVADQRQAALLGLGHRLATSS
jgi:DNA-binding NarL/FixJ family response regulator